MPCLYGVAPRAGAWIETAMAKVIVDRRFIAPLRMGVGRNRVEISIVLQE